MEFLKIFKDLGATFFQYFDGIITNYWFLYLILDNMFLYHCTNSDVDQSCNRLFFYRFV